MNPLLEELSNWVVLLKQADDAITAEDRQNISKIMTGLIKCRVKDVEDVIGESYPEAN